MTHPKFFFAAALLVLIAAKVGYSFDIAIYSDPVSDANSWYLGEHRAWYDGTDAEYRATYFNFSPSVMEDTYRWYKEMGVDYVMVNYPFNDNFYEIPVDTGMRIKVMNWFYPGHGTMHGDKYVDAQFRNVQVGFAQEDLLPNDPLGFWTFDSSIGENAERIEEGGPSFFAQQNLRPVVKMDSVYGDTLWRATSNLGAFSGWDYYTTGWLDSSIYMPMHYKLTWAVDPNGTIDTTTSIADFYWMVHTPNDTMYGIPNTHWWRFPVKTLTLDTLPDTTNWISSEFYEDAHSGFYHLLDDNFAVVDTIEWQDVYFGPANQPRGLDEIPSGQVSYGGRTSVRMAVYYRGTHAFFLNRIEVYDEGAWRMFALTGDDSADYADSIAAAFQYEFAHSNGKSAGWYYDEWDLSGRNNGNPVLKSIVQVNKILDDHNLPTFFINGDPGMESGNWPRNFLLREDSLQGIRMSTHMNEFYFLGGGTCTPNTGSYGSSPVEFHLTDSSSDGPYISLDPCGSAIPDQGDGPQTRYAGEKSLQCGIDGYIWDWRYAMNHGGPDHSAIDVPWNDGVSPMMHASLLEQTRIVHERGEKHWALLQGDWDGVQLDSPLNCCPIRVPTPNETKLGAWLAVACDVDGIMWYPWKFGGLLEWTDTTHTGIQQTDRYASAKKACTEIKRIEPILESLEFVKTYASRAFETDYPDSAYEATAKDVLFSGEEIMRTVENIEAFVPDGEGWEEEAEDNPYVQVSRSRSAVVPENNPDFEDYWFLVVNRRALDDERRKITLTIDVGTPNVGDPYFVEYVLGDSVRLAAPCPTPSSTCTRRFVDIILEPGEAELIHFTRSVVVCSPAIATLDSARSVRIKPLSSTHVQLRWGQVIETDSGDTYTVDEYFVLGSPRENGPFTPIGVTSDTTYIDSIFTIWPKFHYMVQACGEITE